MIPLRVRNVPRIASRTWRRSATYSTSLACPVFPASLRNAGTRCGQPWHERGVLDRIPSPVAAPAQTEYAQCAPRKTPQVRKAHVTMVPTAGDANPLLPGKRMISAPRAKAKGTVKPTYPRYSMGGGSPSRILQQRVQPGAVRGQRARHQGKKDGRRSSAAAERKSVPAAMTTEA